MIESIQIQNEASYGSPCETLSGLLKFNFIYGSNGSGKTTISRIIADESIFSDCRLVWRGGISLEPLVYNRDFVEKNFNPSSELKGLDSKAQRIADLFAVSDAMSISAQKHRHRNFIGLVIFALSAVVSQQSYGFFLQWPLLIASLGLGGLSFGLYQHSQYHRLEEKYLDFRALAEGLRVQFFWYVAGVNLSTTDFFLRDQRDELEWIRQAIAQTHLQMPIESRKEAHEWIIERWIRDQRFILLATMLKAV